MTQSENKSIKSFTGARGVACLFVMFTHLELPEGFESLHWSGAQAVYFFFVLSGYLLMKSGLTTIQPKAEVSPRRFLNLNLVIYLVKRFFRIYPVFLVGILGHWIEYNTIRLGAPVDIWKWLTCQYNFNNHLWTMPAEISFYIFMLPVILVVISEAMILDYKYLRNNRIKIFTASTYLALILAICYMQYRYRDIFALEDKANVYTHWPVFGYGVLAGAISYYIKYFKLRGFPIDPNASKTRKIVVEVITWIIMLRIFLGNKIVGEVYLKIGHPTFLQSQAMITPFYALLLLVIELTNSQCSVAQVFSSTYFYELGVISYSVYIEHFVGVECLWYLTGKRGLVLVAHILGYICYHLVEDRSVKFGNKIVKKLERFQKKNKDVSRIEGDNIILKLKEDTVEIHSS
jgi:peptidoglycan/LPS O-acetylase OafA/YrhL